MADEIRGPEGKQIVDETLREERDEQAARDFISSLDLEFASENSPRLKMGLKILAIAAFVNGAVWAVAPLVTKEDNSILEWVVSIGSLGISGGLEYLRRNVATDKIISLINRLTHGNR